MRKLIALAAFLVSSPLAAQNACDGQMTIFQCYDAMLGVPTGAGDQRTELATANTGSPSSNSATDDFNPRFAASVDAADSDGGESDGAITLSWQDFAQKFVRKVFGDGDTYENSSQQHKLVVKLNPPELYTPLREALAADAADELEEGLDDFDDVSVSLRFSLVSERFGRDLAAPSRSAYVSAIQIASLTDSTGAATAGFAVDRMVQELGRRPAGFDAERPLGPQLDAAEMEQLVAVLAADVSATVANTAAFDRNVRDNGLYDLLALVNNQPQLILSVEARERDDLVGADERSLKFSYEFGGIHVGKYERERGDCGLTKEVVVNGRPASFTQEEASAEVECLRTFMSTRRADVKEGSRFAASIEYVQRSSYHFTGPLTTPLTLPKEETLVASLKYGRYLRSGVRDDAAAGASRIDIAAAYEDVSNDPSRQSRSKATVTYSQEVNDGLFLELAYGWASDPEFLAAGSGNEQSARAGLTYKLAGRKD